MNEWKKKYLAVLEELVRVKSQSERQEEAIQELRLLCNQQQDEVRQMTNIVNDLRNELHYMKYKDAGKQ